MGWLVNITAYGTVLPLVLQWEFSTNSLKRQQWARQRHYTKLETDYRKQKSHSCDVSKLAHIITSFALLYVQSKLRTLWNSSLCNIPNSHLALNLLDSAFSINLHYIFFFQWKKCFTISRHDFFKAVQCLVKPTHKFAESNISFNFCFHINKSNYHTFTQR
jgi:hypothetical protein